MKLLNIDLAAVNEADKYIGKNKEVSFTLSKNDDFVKWGPNNDLPYWLSSLATCSPTHSSLLKLKSTLTAGAGFLYDELNTDLKSFIDDSNLEEVLSRVATDITMFNGFAIQVIYDKKHKNIARLEHLSLPSLRIQNS